MDSSIIEVAIGDYLVSTDPLRVDVGLVHEYLAHESYWAAGRPLDVVERSIANSAVVVGAYDRGGAMAGFGRMVSDLATFAWLCDVFVLDDHKACGLGVSLVKTLVEHPAVCDVKRQLLATGDAHGLYARFGFEPLEDSNRWMGRSGPGH